MTYAFSDLHGRYDLWCKIKEIIKPEDTVICLGDNLDRGSGGIKIYQEQKELGVILLKGNHEQLAANGIRFFTKKSDVYSNKRLWFWNGGEATWDTICEKPPHILNRLADKFEQLPLHYGIVFEDHIVICCHAGYTPDIKDSYDEVNITEEDLLWDRSHFWDPWPTEDKYKHLYIVHGHTPVQYLAEQLNMFNHSYLNKVKAEWTDKNNNIKPKMIQYCNGHKIDIDLGSIVSNRAVLLNLNTFEPIYVEGEDYEH